MIYNYVCRYFSFCTPYLWETFANDVSVVFTLKKKEKQKEQKKRGKKDVLLSEYDPCFYSFSLLLLACSRI